MSKQADTSIAAGGGSGSARETILGRIRAALGRPDTAMEPLDLYASEAWSHLPRQYQRISTLGYEQRLELFEDRLRDYDSHVQRVTRDSLASAIDNRIAQRSCCRMLLPPGLPCTMLPGSSIFTVDADFSHTELDQFDGVITLATVGIATSGTLVLQGVPGQGRRAATLIPDYHLCIISADDVVETVPEAFARIQQTTHLPTTFISGPSATADIEMTRIKGVHGPRTLDVLLVTPED